MPQEHIEAENTCNGDCGGSCFQCCLFSCGVCGGAEGSLPTECPGERMTTEQMDAVMDRRLNFKNGSWVDKVCIEVIEGIS